MDSDDDALAQVVEEAWLACWRMGPAAQIRLMDAIRDSVHAIRGGPTPEERAADLEHHVRLSERMRSADRHR